MWKKEEFYVVTWNNHTALGFSYKEEKACTTIQEALNLCEKLQQVQSVYCINIESLMTWRLV